MLNAELLLVTVVLVFSLKYNIKFFLLSHGCYFKDSWGCVVLVWKLKALNKTIVSISTNALLGLYKQLGIVGLQCVNNVFPIYSAESKNPK